MSTTAPEPRWLLDDALRRARTAYRLATTHADRLNERFSPNLLSQLASDRALLGDASARGAIALATRKTATRHERELAAAGHDLVMAIRNAARRTADVPHTLLTAIGVGDGLTDRNTQAVVAALRAIVANAVPLAACGVTPGDVAEAQHLADDLLAADGRQSEHSEARSVTTEERHDAQLRLEAAVAQISARAALAFRADTVVRSRFERLVATSGPTAEDEAAAGAEPTPPAATTAAASAPAGNKPA